MPDIFVTITMNEGILNDVSGFPTEAEARTFAVAQLDNVKADEEEAVDWYDQREAEGNPDHTRRSPRGRSDRRPDWRVSSGREGRSKGRSNGMSLTKVPLSGQTEAKGRNGYFKAGRIDVYGNWSISVQAGPKDIPDSWQHVQGVHIEVVSTKPRGEPAVNIELQNTEAVALGQALIAAGSDIATLYSVDETDFAYHYDRAACPRCRTGEECEDSHEDAATSTYFALPAERRAELIDKANGALCSEEIGDAIANALVALAEQEVTP